MCGSVGGSFILATGTCDCNDSPTLNEICDEDCRDAALQVTCEDENTLVVSDPTTGAKVSLDLSALGAEGAIDCSNPESNVYSMGTNNGVFSATYGLGTTLTDQLAQSRRRLNLIPPTPIPLWSLATSRCSMPPTPQVSTGLLEVAGFPSL
jgi:hypothetical protein